MCGKIWLELKSWNKKYGWKKNHFNKMGGKLWLELLRWNKKLTEKDSWNKIMTQNLVGQICNSEINFVGQK